MSLPHAILGFLREEALTGYDLKKRFDRSLRHFWPADRAQIYRTLSALAQEGWVVVEGVPQEGKPDQRVHHITAAGLAELGRWLAQPLPIAEVREATLIQIYFADVVGDQAAQKMLEAQRDERVAQLAELERLRAELDAALGAVRRPPRTKFFRRLTLEHGIAMVQAEVQWLSEAVVRLEALRRNRWKEGA